MTTRISEKIQTSKMAVGALFVLAVSLVGIFLRTANLSTISVSISYDQLDHAINGLAIKHTGKDFEGQHYLWELMPTVTHTYTSEWGALWHAAFPQISDSPITQAKLPNVLFGFIFSIAFSIFVFQIFKSKLMSVLAWTGIILSPWHIFISRTGYEAPISLSLLMVSIVCFWQYFDMKIKWKRVLITLAFLITMLASFYTYHGYKFLYPMIFVLVFFWRNRARVWQDGWKMLPFSRFLPLFLILIIWSAAFLLFFVRIQAGVYGNRSGEISFLNTELISERVNKTRQESLESPAKTLFTNKATVLFDMASKNFASAVDFKMLFISGFDEAFALGLWAHGFLYLLQAPLIVLGGYWLWQHYKENSFYLIAFGLVSLAPVLIHTSTSMTFRSSLFIPILIILSALGAEMLIKTTYLGKRSLLTFLAVIFAFSVVNFLYFYNVRYPVYAVDASMFNERLLSSYLKRVVSTDSKISVYAPEPYNTARMFAYLSGNYDKASVVEFMDVIHENGMDPSSFQNLRISDTCPVSMPVIDETIIAEPSIVENCELEEWLATSEAYLNISSPQNRVITLPSPKDNGHYYKIYNDTLCNNEKVPSFISIQKLNLFDLESLSDSEFCQNWVRTESL